MIQELRQKGYGNTTNQAYPSSKIGLIHRWSPTAELQKYRRLVLDKPFDPPANRKDLQPLIQYHPTTYLRPFGQEVTLTARLETSLLLDHDRALREMARAGHFPPHHTPLCTDVGANAYCRPSRKDKATGQKFEVDRCAKAEKEESMLNAVNRCPGDIKCGHKFQALWRDYLMSDDVGYKALGMEYCNVLAQLRHYLVDIGFRDDDERQRMADKEKINVPKQGAKYGYILTNEEVVLIKREKNPRGDMVLYATDGFPLRATPGCEINGMIALLLIHLLAANEDGYLITNGLADR